MSLAGSGVLLVRFNCSRQLTDRFSEQLLDLCALPAGQVTAQHRAIPQARYVACRT